MPPDDLDRFIAIPEGVPRSPWIGNVWSIPVDIVSDGDKLLWRVPAPLDPLANYKQFLVEVPFNRRLDRAMLSRFLALENARTGRDFVAYAKQWGVLSICSDHHQPGAHLHADPSPHIVPALPWYAAIGAYCLPPMRDGWHVESFDDWRTISRQLNAVIRLEQSLRDGGTGTDQDWTSINRSHFNELRHDPRYKGMGASLRNLAGYSIADQLDDWLRLGGVRVTPRRSPDGTLFADTNVTGLFGALALHLFTALAGARTWAWCAHCSQLFFPARRPAQGQRVYCTDCQEDNEPAKAAKAAYKERQHAGEVDRGSTSRCQTCGTAFLKRNHRQRFCTEPCRRQCELAGWQPFDSDEMDPAANVPHADPKFDPNPGGRHHHVVDA